MLKMLRLIYFPISVALTSIIVLPICLLRPTNYKNSAVFLRVYRFFAFPLLGVTVSFKNREILDSTKPAVVVGNHQHNLDIILATHLFKYKTVSLGKRQIAFIPLFGQIFWLCGNILITRGNKKSAMETMRRVENYLSTNELGLVIFPEGHRNTGEELLPFKKGAFYTAVNCQIPIVPFAVSHYARNLDLNKWEAAKMNVNILEPIPTKGLTEKDIPDLMEKVRVVLTEGIAQMNKEAGY